MLYDLCSMLNARLHPRPKPARPPARGVEAILWTACCCQKVTRAHGRQKTGENCLGCMIPTIFVQLQITINLYLVHFHS
jgi:hypothetical protein